MSKEALIKEINDKYKFCSEFEEELENEDSADYNQIAKENLETVFLNMGRLNKMTDDELVEILEDLNVTFNHLEDLGY